MHLKPSLIALVGSFCCSLVSAQLSAVAIFDQDGVSGQITFEELSCDGLTKMVVSLKGLDNRADNWHVHELPAPEFNCLKTGGHYNPAPLNKLGELTEKFGDFRNMDTVNRNFYDDTLPLQGTRSIIGRSIVIHSGPNRLACATIRPTGADEKAMEERIARATFTGGEYDTKIKGTITFRQFPGSALTRIMVHMRGSGTEGHNWHVHVSPADSSKDNGICTSTGGHLDPRRVEIPNQYNCDPENPESCYTGDLSGKHGKLDFPEDFISIMYTDIDLPLFGSSSIVGRGITIHHQETNARISCATILDVEPLKYMVSFPGVDGSIKFTQRLAYFEPTYMQIDLKNVQEDIGGWHVHSLPVNALDETDCASTAGHWIPNIVVDKVNRTGDQYEVGDLTGKWGKLNEIGGSSQVIQATFVDYHLPLSGDWGIAGRSVVFHKDDATKARVLCGNIKLDGPGRKVVASFGKYEAKLLLNNDATKNLGSISALPAPSGKGILMTVDLVSDAASTGHKMHIHVNPVTGSDCATALGHYDPEGVEVEGYTCDPANPKACYYGDLSGKFGAFSILTASAPKVIYEPNLTLDDLMARSIVIHEANGGAPRYGCGSFAIANENTNQNAFGGIVTFVQSRRSGDRPATMFVDLKNPNGSSGPHPWHVHEKPTPDTGDCSETGGHHDPFNANVEGAEYPGTPDREHSYYEMGDLSSKTGDVQVPARLIEQDMQMSMMGKEEYSMGKGRSITFHQSRQNGARIACASLNEYCPVTYTICRTPTDCASRLGGDVEEWDCVDKSATKKANCETLSSDCKEVLCSNDVPQTVYPGANVGHCAPSALSETPYKYASSDRDGTSAPTVSFPSGTQSPSIENSEPADSDPTTSIIIAVMAVGTLVFGTAFVVTRNKRQVRSVVSRHMTRFGLGNAMQDQNGRALKSVTFDAAEYAKKSSSDMDPFGNDDSFTKKKKKKKSKQIPVHEEDIL